MAPSIYMNCAQTFSGRCPVLVQRLAPYCLKLLTPTPHSYDVAQEDVAVGFFSKKTNKISHHCKHCVLT